MKDDLISSVDLLIIYIYIYILFTLYLSIVNNAPQQRNRMLYNRKLVRKRTVDRLGFYFNGKVECELVVVRY